MSLERTADLCKRSVGACRSVKKGSRWPNMPTYGHKTEIFDEDLEDITNKLFVPTLIYGRNQLGLSQSARHLETYRHRRKLRGCFPARNGHQLKGSSVGPFLTYLLRRPNLGWRYLGCRDLLVQGTFFFDNGSGDLLPDIVHVVALGIE